MWSFEEFTLEWKVSKGIQIVCIIYDGGFEKRTITLLSNIALSFDIKNKIFYTIFFLLLILSLQNRCESYT